MFRFLRMVDYIIEAMLVVLIGTLGINTFKFLWELAALCVNYYFS